MLREAIDSVLAQTFCDYELVVVDNASTDGTRAALDAFRDARLGVHRNSHTVGLYANHNVCLGHARADWIVFLHSDELLVPSALESFHRAIQSTGVASGALIPAHDRPHLRSMKEMPWFGAVLYAPHSHALTLSGIGQPSGVCWSRRSLVELGGFDAGDEVAYTAEHDAYASFASAGWPIVPVHEPIEIHVPNEHQATHWYISTGKATHDLARFVLRMSRRPGWREAVSFLAGDIPRWPPDRAAHVLFELAIAGLSRDYELISRSCRGTDVESERVARNARLIHLFGPDNYFRVLDARRRMRRLLPT